MDEIQVKLEQLERELTPHAWLLAIPNRSPLLGPALGLILGITLQQACPLGLLFWICTAPVLVGGWITLYRIHQITVQTLALLATTAMVILGGMLMLHDGQRGPYQIVHLVQSEPRILTLRGQVLTAPRQAITDAGQDRYRTQWTLSCDKVLTSNGWQSCHGRLTVSVYDKVPEVQRGDRIQLSGWLHPLHNPTNPGQFDQAAYLLRQGIVGRLTLKSHLGCRILAHAPPWSLTRLHQRLIEHAEFLHNLGRPSNDDYGLSRALLLGRRDSMPSHLFIAFRKTGLLHLISLSGMHIGILASMAWSVGWLFRCLKPGKAWITALAVLIFVLIVPPRSATLRTAIICWVFCAGHILRRPSNGLNLLSLAAIILLCLRPSQLFDVGWQLSFSCVLSILLFFPRLYGSMHRFLQGCFSKVTNGFVRLIYRGLLGVTALLCTGLCAWLGGSGILLFHFHTLTPLSPLWTLLALPWVYLIFTLGLIKLIAGLFSTSLCLWLAPALTKLEQLLAWGTETLAHHASGIWVVGHISILWVGLYYVTLLAMLLPWQRRGRRLRVLTTVSWLVIIGGLTWTAYRHDHPICPCITLLDVGHGQAAVVQHPNGSTFLIDAGSLYNPAIGEQVINPFLNICGIDRLEAIIISHPDQDHLNGLSDVLSQTPGTVIYTPAPFVHRLSPYLRDCPANCIPPIESLPAKGILGDKIHWEIWWPTPDLDADWGSDNNLSMVMRLSYAEHRLLFCSDIEQPAQQRILHQHPNQPCEVIVAPHHGSSRTLLPEFLEQMACGPILISGADPETLTKYPHVLRTCTHGSIRIQWPKEGPFCLHFGTKTGHP